MSGVRALFTVFSMFMLLLFSSLDPFLPQPDKICSWAALGERLHRLDHSEVLLTAAFYQEQCSSSEGSVMVGRKLGMSSSHRGNILDEQLSKHAVDNHLLGAST